MNEFWRKFWGCKDTGHIISASITGGFCFLMIFQWALQDHNPLAKVLTLLGGMNAIMGYRYMGAEIKEPEPSAISLSFAIISWIAPVLAVGLLVFSPFPGAGTK